MKYLNGIKKSEIISLMYEKGFKENAALAENVKCKEFYKLLYKLESENQITFEEADILEDGLNIDLEALLQYIDIEPRIKVVVK